MVILIISVLVSIAGLTTKTRNENLALSIQHEKLRSLFFRAKTLTMNSVDANGVCGYGIYVDINITTGMNTLKVFKDVENTSGNCNFGVGGVGYYDSRDEFLTTSVDVLDESSGIGIACFTGASYQTTSTDFINAAYCPTSLVFVPPDPTVKFNRGTVNLARTEIAVGTYSKRSPQKTKRVILNTQGLIDARQN